MFNSKVKFSMLASVAILALGVAVSAHAAPSNIAAATDSNKASIYQPNAPVTNELVASLKAAKDDAAIRAILAPVIKANPSDAQPILNAVKAQAPELSARVFQIIIALLSLDPANDPLVEKLTADNADIIAQIAGGNVEPAAGGPGGDTPEAGGPTGNPENPNQLNEPGATPPPASPSSPSA